MLRVELPPGHAPERRYAVDVLLRTMLGLEYVAVDGPPGRWTLRLRDDDSFSIAFPDVFFPAAERAWLQAESLPVDPAAALVVEGKRLPAMCADLRGASDHGRDGLCAIDVFGTVFLVVTRYEERVVATRDALDRFPCSASLLARGGWVETPVVDELAAALANLLARTWPALRCQRGAYTVRLTHDVDALRNSGRTPAALAKAVAGDLLSRRSPRTALGRVRAALAGTARLHEQDPFNSFDFMMDAAERHGLQSHYYFVPRPRNRRYDPDYAIDEPVVRDLFRRIASRGHGIGLHASFDAAWRDDGIVNEATEIRAVLGSIGKESVEIGGRHHYLRWRPEVSWKQWDSAGLQYDSSLGFAEEPGFRCGTSHSFRVWDFESRTSLRLIERPLIAMDSTLYNYLGLGHDEMVERVRRLATVVRSHHGSLVLLWHNHNLLTEEAREAFSAMLEAACSR